MGSWKMWHSWRDGVYAYSVVTDGLSKVWITMLPLVCTTWRGHAQAGASIHTSTRNTIGWERDRVGVKQVLEAFMVIECKICKSCLRCGQSRDLYHRTGFVQYDGVGNLRKLAAHPMLLRSRHGPTPIQRDEMSIGTTRFQRYPQYIAVTL